MSCQLQIVAAHPVVAKKLLQILSGNERLRGLLARPPILDLERLPLLIPLRLFIVDTHILPMELSKLLRLLRVRCQRARFVVLIPTKSYTEPELIRLLYLGIEGILTFTEQLHVELVSAVQLILDGDVWAPYNVVRKYQWQMSRFCGVGSKSTLCLTRREYQVFGMLVRSLSNREIAEALRISERTVKFHVSNIFLKVGIKRRSGLVNLLLCIQ